MGTATSWQAFVSRLRRSRRRAGRGQGQPLEALESRLMLAAVTEPFEQHFDFGTAGSPVAADNVSIRSGTSYSAELGYGWTDGSIQSRDRGANAGDERVRDFNFTSQATFAVDVPNGVYEVTVIMGDGRFPRDEMGVYLEGVHVDTVSAAGGEYETRTFTVTVLDGQLTLGLQDLGGEDDLVMINALDVVQTGGDPSGPQLVESTPDVEVFDSLQQFTVTFNEEIDATTFASDDVTLSGPDGVVAPTAITQIDGVTFEIQFAAQSAFGDYTLQIGPDIADLDGHLMNQDSDDVNGEAGEDLFSALMTLSPTPEFLQTYDFGTGSSPVGPGANQVSDDTTYSSETGFGWSEGMLDSRDRGETAGDELSRDFNFTTTGATFVVDVLEDEAIYDVTVVLGDVLAARDEMGIFLEGAQVDSVSSAAGGYATRTFRVTVSDGQLTLRLEDLGGADPTAVINSLQVRHVETIVPPDDDCEDEDDPDKCDGGGGDDDGSDCDRDHQHAWWKRTIRKLFRKFKEHWGPGIANWVTSRSQGHSGDGSSYGSFVRLVGRFGRRW